MIAVFLTALLCADDRNLDKKICADYAKLGATQVWLPFKEPIGEYQGFRFEMLDEGRLPKLPIVNVPFGLDLHNTKLTDDGMKELKTHTRLVWLDLRKTSITDSGLKELKDLKRLFSLRLGETKVSDEGSKVLKEFSDLLYLDLHDTGLTDAGIAQLKDLKKLEQLDLYNSKVTSKGKKELQEALPECRIH